MQWDSMQKAWTGEDRVANVFIFADLADRCHVTHDKDDEDNDTKLKFPRDEVPRSHSHRFLTE